MTVRKDGAASPAGGAPAAAPITGAPGGGAAQVDPATQAAAEQDATADKTIYDELSKLTGLEFDIAFLYQAKEEAEDEQELYSLAETNSQNPDVVDFAKQCMQAAQDKVALATQILTAMGVSMPEAPTEGATPLTDPAQGMAPAATAPQAVAAALRNYQAKRAAGIFKAGSVLRRELREKVDVAHDAISYIKTAVSNGNVTEDDVSAITGKAAKSQQGGDQSLLKQIADDLRDVLGRVARVERTLDLEEDFSSDDESTDETDEDNDDAEIVTPDLGGFNLGDDDFTPVKRSIAHGVAEHENEKGYEDADVDDEDADDAEEDAPDEEDAEEDDLAFADDLDFDE